ncbi:hypothetical protein ACFV6E_38630 [Streptomyces sp. NPDC059785]|uniref:SCO2102 family sporulation regulator n=1 Tax=unclassified Streptomyces TaxID=2593676 RepID=UPI00364DCDE5
MGWTVLYIAFGIVALWLLGEVLLQYKARLRWRLLAFVGFLGVVLGVLIPSVVVIGLGAAAFAVGQTYVTLSFRRGFATGWSIGARQGAPKPASKRRRGEPDPQGPAAEDSGPEMPGTGPAYADDDEERDLFTPVPPAGTPASAAETTAVYEPQPMPDDTGSYGVYSDAAYAAATDPSYATGQSQDQQAYAYDGYSGYDQQQYGYDANGQQQYAGYTDPYAGAQNYGTGYDTSGYGDQQAYGQQGYDQSQYGTGGYGETPAGGVWVPQQRNAEDPYGGELPPEQQYPYQGDGNTGGQGGHGGNGYDGQYRY